MKITDLFRRKNLSLACDKNDDLWVGTADKGLFWIDFIDGNYEKLSAIAYARSQTNVPLIITSKFLLLLKGVKHPIHTKWNNDRFSGSKVDSHFRQVVIPLQSLMPKVKNL